MTTTDLMMKVKEMLNEDGFATKPAYRCDDYSYMGHATKDGRTEIREYTKYGITSEGKFGDEILFNVVARRNDADRDISVDIKLIHWEESSGKTIAKQRVNINMSDKQIRNRVSKIITEWNAR